MLFGSTSAHCLRGLYGQSESDDEMLSSGNGNGNGDGNGSGGDAGQRKYGIEERLGDAGPESGPQSLSLVTLAATQGMSMSTSKIYCILIVH